MYDKVIARFTVDYASEMTEEGRRQIADWLRIQADNLEEEGHNYSTVFNARYIATIQEPVEKIDG